MLNWRNYLLEAGMCTTLGAKITQRVRLDPEPEHMRKLPLKSAVLSGKKVLIVDKESVPPATKHEPTVSMQAICAVIICLMIHTGQTRYTPYHPGHGRQDGRGCSRRG
jgi:hypothetical protein